jgi:hypothetical protein
MSEFNQSEYVREYIKSNYKRFTINIRPELFENFRQKCSDNGTTPTTAIKQFIAEYTATDK